MPRKTVETAIQSHRERETDRNMRSIKTMRLLACHSHRCGPKIYIFIYGLWLDDLARTNEQSNCESFVLFIYHTEMHVFLWWL